MASAKAANMRNQPCPCGSGRKYKQCCIGKQDLKAQFMAKWAWIGLAALFLAGVAGFAYNMITADEHVANPSGGVWSEEHGHYH